MSTSLFDFFKYSKLLDITEGKMVLMKTPVNIIPTSILCEQQKILTEKFGLEKAYQTIYGAAKRGSIDYNNEFIKRMGFSDRRKIIDWQVNVVAFSGWGEIEPALEDLGNNKFSVHFKNSSYPIAYGKADYAVDFISTGFVAGGISAAIGRDLDAVEVSCAAKGDNFCEMEVGPPTTIESRRLELWRKWGLYEK